MPKGGKDGCEHNKPEASHSFLCKNVFRTEEYFVAIERGELLDFRLPYRNGRSKSSALRLLYACLQPHASMTLGADMIVSGLFAKA